MPFKDAHSRLRQAVEILYREQHRIDRDILLREAWQSLYSLREEDFPPEFRSLFAYLQHEMERAEREEMSPREINLLILKIQELELKWIELPPKQQDDQA
jgi:hypothetical protein